jgi:dTDP-4-amino-4,6-dideoxygalactose transaminase
VEAIVRAGARPLFVDIEPETYLMNVAQIEKKITSKTRAILPVHLYGQSVDMAPLMKLAEKYKLAVVEDVAQAHGATHQGKKAGSFGEAGCFSFYPTKNLGAYGDGGAITLQDEKLYRRLLELRVHGTPPTDKYFHQEFAANSRLDEIQAAILDVKLPHLAGWIAKRQKIAAAYQEAFREEKSWLKTPVTAEGCNHVYHQYTVRTSKRDALKEFLTAQGIAVSVYYPHPIHLLPPLKPYGYKAGDFPETERAAREALSLPCFPQMTEGDLYYTIQQVKAFRKKA